MFRPMQITPVCLNVHKVLVTAYAVEFDGLKIPDDKLHQLPSTLNLQPKQASVGEQIVQSKQIMRPSDRV